LLFCLCEGAGLGCFLIFSAGGGLSPEFIHRPLVQAPLELESESKQYPDKHLRELLYRRKMARFAVHLAFILNITNLHLKYLQSWPFIW